MRLKDSYLIHLAAIHIVVLGVAAWRYESLGRWFFLIEALVVLSWLVGIWLARRSLQPLDFVQSFSDLLHEREFSARFSTVGQSEMDPTTILAVAYTNIVSDTDGWIDGVYVITPDDLESAKGDLGGDEVPPPPEAEANVS